MKKIILLVILIGFASNSFAQQEKQQSTKPASKEVAALRMANNLAHYGYENYSASALIEAARILIQTPTQPLEPQSITNGEAKGKEEAKTSKAEFAPTELLTDAKKYANGDTVILALASQVEKLASESTRGRVGGPARTVTAVKAGATDEFVIKFWNNELAEILVSGDGDTDLDIYVYDQNGNLIVSDADYSDDCYVSWVPAWTGPYIVKVVNRGRVLNRYVFVTN